MDIFEYKLPENKSIFFALLHIYGVGKNRALNLCKTLGFSKNLKIKDVSYDQKIKIENYLMSFDKELTTSLRSTKLISLNNLIKIKSYRGVRLRQGLPVRGQRTHTNAKNARKKHLKY